ncbi:MAG: class I SAM-dependent methyltransferase [Lachnospiraceae bacterium]|nr:class I SAM-dependent methyltransferase [Lachnospiraceae bacterium]
MIEKFRKTCLSCGGSLSAPLFESDNFPASAQDIPLKEELSHDCGITLRLCRCEKCGLFQLDCEPVTYYRDVIRAVGLSDTMKELRRNDYRHMIEEYGLSGKKFIECGCGNGDFLKVLSEFPVEIYGTEANEKFADEASEKVPKAHIIHAFTETPDTLVQGAPFDCFLSFNFLEHQPDPMSMLKCMYSNLSENGYGLITVPSFEYILNEAKYYELIRDHIANYTLTSLCYLCENAGFSVIEKGFIGIGDTLRVVVKKEVPASEASAINIEEFDNTLGKSFDSITKEVSDYTEGLKKSGKTLSMWGAGHQGFTIASTTVLKDYVSCIIDSAPFKQGRFAPASHIPIVSPEYFIDHPTDVILVAAPGYVKEISGTIRRIYGEKAPEIKSILDF